MQKSAIEKAKDRLNSAKARLRDMECAKNYESARRQWYEFLSCSNAVFSVLEQGSKGSGKSSAWFGTKKHERKNDPLLCYLLHARNADEHNVPSVTGLDRQKIVMVEDGEPIAEITDMVGNQGTFLALSNEASPDLTKINGLRIYPERAKLIRVRDRGVDYDPPTEHVGSTISDSAPIAIASSAVRYLESLVAEAEALALNP